MLWPVNIRGVLVSVIFLGCWCASLVAEEHTTSAARLIELAKEADKAREAEREMLQAWEADSLRLEVMLLALNDESKRLSKKQQQLNTTNQALSQEVSATRAAQAALGSIQEKTQDLRQELERALDDIIAQSALQLAHQNTEQQQELPPASDALALRDSLSRLADAERQTRSISRRQLSGLLPDGSRRVASALSLGGAAAWWLNDSAAGSVRVVDGTVFFDPVENAKEVAAIRRAFEHHGGKEMGELPLLPIPAQAKSSGTTP